MGPLEIEVKFQIADKGTIRKRLIDLAAAPQGCFFESNIRYETGDHSLIRRKSLLRLRKDQKNTLTFKSPVEGSTDNDFKIHNELEVEVSDFATTDRILRALGFHPEQVYEKWRETFRFGNSIVCLDTLPFGDFLEIEGEKEEIREAAVRLGLVWGDRILSNYLALFDFIRQELQLGFTDVTFDHFNALDPTPRPYAELIRRHEKQSRKT